MVEDDGRGNGRVPRSGGAAVLPMAVAPGIAQASVCKVGDGARTAAWESADALAVEEPLEIRVGFGGNGGERRAHRAVSVTMRTPGHDPDLAAGFLLTEGIVRSATDIEAIWHCGPPTPEGHRNVVRAELRPGVVVDLDRLERHFYTTSSCGVCGKTSIEAVRVAGGADVVRDERQPVFDAALIHRLPALLRAAQAVFEQTGGLHAAALFDADGRLICLREDVGRHNAVDKVIGAQLLVSSLPLDAHLLLVSGRASFELVQKADLAGIPILAAVGAPSSLAVELARARAMTLLGFVRNERFNIYAGAGRVRTSEAAA